MQIYRQSWTQFAFLRSLVVILLVSSIGRSSQAQLAMPMSDPSTSRESRNEVLQAIPFDRLSPDAKRKISGVVEHPTMYRRLPNKTIECDPDLYIFLIRNPEVVVNMWQLMGITTVQCKRLGPFTHEGSDGAGTLAKMDLIYGTKDIHIYYADGHHEGPIFKRHLNGRCVIVLRTAYEGNGDYETKVNSKLDFFLALDNVGADLVARTVQPLVGKTADNNFAESLNFVGQMSRAAAQKGDSVHQLSKRLNNVEPEVRDQFASVAMNVFQRAAVQRLKNRDREDATALIPAGFPDMDSESEPQTAKRSNVNSAKTPVIRNAR